MKLFILFIFLLLIPLTLALDCSNFNDKEKELCLEILKQPISLEHKELLISNLEYKDNFKPNHQFIENYNLAINFDRAPYNVETFEKSFIKRAWLKIITIMPSVVENNTLYCHNNGELLTEYNYDIVYPEKLDNDCKTEFKTLENNANLFIYLNNKLIGNNKLTYFTTNEDPEFNAYLDVNIKTQIAHYQNKKYCCNTERYCSYKKRYCWRGVCWTKCIDYETRCSEYCYRCELDNIEIKNDNLQLNDVLKAKLYDKIINYNLEIVDKYWDSIKYKLNYDDFTALELSFENSKFSYFPYFYDINYSLKPYYVFTLNADRIDNVVISNLFRFNDYLVVKNANKCNIKVWNHFLSGESDCNSSFDKINLYIKTNKLIYKENEIIKVEIFPKDLIVDISYNNLTKKATNYVEFNTNKQSNKITAKHNDISYDKVIFIINNDKYVLVWDLFVFVILVYLFYLFVKEYLKSA